jgi:hypothetical protein
MKKLFLAKMLLAVRGVTGIGALRSLALGGLLAFAWAGFASAATTIDWRFYDFFNVPPGEWWDARLKAYGEAPIGAECFTATGIANGLCTPIQPAVDDLASYPYTHLAGPPIPSGAIYAPFRMEVTGVEVPGYTLAEPVFLPVMNSGESAGSSLDFDWSMQFLDTATALVLDGLGCPNAGIDDGYHVRTQITLAMDLQESKRIFGVVAADAAAAQAWWNANTHTNCNVRGSVEQAMWNWLIAMGGSSSVPGKYDIMNAYEWFLDQIYLQMSATVDPDGTTHVTIDHLSWGTSNMLNRMFYWGSTSYLANTLDSSAAAGWSGMEEYAWFEDFSFTGSLGASDFDFELAAVLPESFRHRALPGPDGNLDQVDDLAIWTWGPNLHDYLNDYLGHPNSELDRYPGGTELDAVPGSATYGSIVPREFVPITWDLDTGETWTFEFPTGDVVFYDPNLTPLSASPTSNDFVEIVAPLGLHSTKPASYGAFDSGLMTWTVVGPSVTGGPDGSPGNYPLEPWGAINLPEPPALLGQLAALGLLGGLHRWRARRR